MDIFEYFQKKMRVLCQGNQIGCYFVQFNVFNAKINEAKFRYIRHLRS